MYTSDKEAVILEHIYYDDSLKQRELADKAGISLGMTNAILKRLIEKGWLMTKRLNNRNISYEVSPAGVEKIFKLGYSCFKKTIDDVILYKQSIEQLVSEAKNAGYKEISLVGKSDLDFILEYACGKNEVILKKIDINQVTGDMFVLYSEQYDIDNKVSPGRWLRTIVIGGKR